MDQLSPGDARRLGVSAKEYLQSELHKFAIAALRSDALNLFAGTRVSDTKGLQEARMMLGVIDRFEKRYLGLVDNLKIMAHTKAKAEKARRPKKRKGVARARSPG